MVTAAAVEHPELAGERHRQPDRAPGRTGCPGPKSYASSASSHTTAVEPLTRTSSSVPQRSRRARGRGRGPPRSPRGTRRAPRASQARGSAAIVVPAGRRHRVAQDHRVLAGVAQHRRRAVHRLGHHLQRRPARHAQQDARRPPSPRPGRTRTRARAGQRGRRVLLVLGDADHLAERGEQLLGVPQVLLARERAGRDDRHRLVHQRRACSTSPAPPATSTGKRRSMNDVVMPAAIEITQLRRR